MDSQPEQHADKTKKKINISFRIYIYILLMLSVHRKQLVRVANGSIPRISRIHTVKSAPSYYGPIALVSLALTAEHQRQNQLSLSQAYAKTTQEDEDRRRRLAKEETLRLLARDAARAKRGIIERISKVIY